MGKLVRDRIPEIIHQAGKTCTTQQLPTAEYAAALRDKLLEEAQEAIAEDADLVTELADLCEVIEAIADLHGLDWHTLRAVQMERREQRGGFRNRLWLSAINGQPLN